MSIKIFSFLALSLCLFSGSANARFKSNERINISDTSGIKFIIQTDWQLISSYVNQSADSTDFEVLISKDISAGTDGWITYREIGQLADLFRPEQDQEVYFSEPNRKWQILFKKEGNVLLKLLDGSVPIGTSMILPIKVKFKNN